MQKWRQRRRGCARSRHPITCDQLKYRSSRTLATFIWSKAKRASMSARRAGSTSSIMRQGLKTKVNFNSTFFVFPCFFSTPNNKENLPYGNTVYAKRSQVKIVNDRMQKENKRNEESIESTVDIFNIHTIVNTSRCIGNQSVYNFVNIYPYLF